MKAYLSYRVLNSVCFYKTVCLSYQYIFDRQLQPQVRYCFEFSLVLNPSIYFFSVVIIAVISLIPMVYLCMK